MLHATHTTRALRWALCAALLAAGALVGIGGPAASEPSGESTFADSSDVAALFAAKCTKCHGGGRTSAGLDLTGAPATLVGAPSSQGGTPLVTAGKPSQSYLYLKVSGKAADGATMPLGGALSDAERSVLRTWIAGGAN